MLWHTCSLCETCHCQSPWVWNTRKGKGIVLLIQFQTVLSLYVNITHIMLQIQCYFWFVALKNTVGIFRVVYAPSQTKSITEIKEWGPHWLHFWFGYDLWGECYIHWLHKGSKKDTKLALFYVIIWLWFSLYLIVEKLKKCRSWIYQT